MNPLLFTDPAFLFCFAPVALTLNHAFPERWRNGFLLAASLTLYGWGEGRNVAALAASIAINYACGLWIARGRSRGALALGVTANLVLLAAFKYPAFIVSNANAIAAFSGARPWPVPKIRLPVGISFFTFMGISYLIDVYRREIESEKSPAIFGLYIALFPHLVAGPIVRFRDIAAQLRRRTASMPNAAQGIRRFAIGLGKKVLIGNTVAATADAVFALPANQLSAPIAWIGALCYTVQIYFDFSGYSDMAIGLARVLGFRFPENFNYPYVSQSIAEFWRRWHISLSTWLRDYLFFPLGARGGRAKLYRNTLIVFFVCGLWHGAAWHFVLWGLWHGVFRVAEAMGWDERIERAPRALRHGYALLVVIIGWVLFRAESVSAGATYLGAMFGLTYAPLADFAWGRLLPLDVMLALAVGCAGSVPVRWRMPPAAEFAALSAVFLLSIAIAAAGTYQPFLYFRF